jgi:hypothetical protein
MKHSQSIGNIDECVLFLAAVKRTTSERATQLAAEPTDANLARSCLHEPTLFCQTIVPHLPRREARNVALLQGEKPRSDDKCSTGDPRCEAPWAVATAGPVHGARWPWSNPGVCRGTISG